MAVLASALQALQLLARVEDPKFAPAVKAFKEMYCTTPNCLSVKFSKIYRVALNRTVQNAINQSQYERGKMCPISVVSLGDEIGVAAPPTCERFCI